MFSNNEEYQRTAVGRYYYPCYLIARDIYNKRKRRKLYSRISHEDLMDHFSDSKYKEDRDVGFRLKELRTIRNNADYDNIFLYDASFSKFKSKELLNILEKLKK